MCECGAILDERAEDDADGGGSALCGTGADEFEAILLRYDLQNIRLGEQ